MRCGAVRPLLNLSSPSPPFSHTLVRSALLFKMSDDLTLDNCLVDVGDDDANPKRFGSLEEQNAYFAKKFLSWASTLKGWRSIANVDGVEIFSRKVSWSPVAHLRSQWVAACGVHDVKTAIIKRNIMKEEEEVMGKEGWSKAPENKTLFAATGKGYRVRIAIVTVPLVWPLSPRQFCFVECFFWADPRYVRWGEGEWVCGGRSSHSRGYI